MPPSPTPLPTAGLTAVVFEDVSARQPWQAAVDKAADDSLREKDGTSHYRRYDLSVLDKDTTPPTIEGYWKAVKGKPLPQLIIESSGKVLYSGSEPQTPDAFFALWKQYSTNAAPAMPRPMPHPEPRPMPFPGPFVHPVPLPDPFRWWGPDPWHWHLPLPVPIVVPVPTPQPAPVPAPTPVIPAGLAAVIVKAPGAPTPTIGDYCQAVYDTTNLPPTYAQLVTGADLPILVVMRASGGIVYVGGVPPTLSDFCALLWQYQPMVATGHPETRAAIRIRVRLPLLRIIQKARNR
jgi:hypothetical protein